MKPEMWVAVEEAYARAVELPPEARTPFLLAAYENRPEIRKEVESLLEHQVAAEALEQSCVAKAAAEVLAEDESPVGHIVAGKYRIRERLGTGGMADVYLADHLALNIPVALKRPKPIVRSDPAIRSWFLQEAQRAVSLDHENVARIRDVVDSDDEIFVVMEYIDGKTLRALLHPNRTLSTDEFLTTAVQCVSALAAAHEKRIVHLDVKPENIMRTSAGQVKICDFGIARRLSADLSDATTRLDLTREILAGTPAYMAPEVVLRQSFDERADIFSLGVVFYEMLTGSNPFSAGTVLATTSRVVSLPAPPITDSRKDIHPKVERIIRRMMAKDPKDRYASAEDVAADLKSFTRSRHRYEDIRTSLKEAFVESRFMQAVAAVLLIGVIASPVAWTYRDAIQRSLWGSTNMKTIVVLPFPVKGNKPSAQYVRGLSEVITERLGELAGITVVSQAEVSDSGIKTAGQAFGLFGANYVVTGSIQAVGDSFEIVLSLADGKEGRQLRAKTLTMATFNSLAAQRQILETVLGFLDFGLSDNPRLAGLNGTSNATADELYLEGTGHLATRTPEGVEKAISRFQDALVLDSNFSLAYAGLGNAYRTKFYLPPRERQWAERAIENCQRAVRLDENLAAGHACLGSVYNLRGENEDAVKEYEAARKLDPDSDDIYRGLGRAYEDLPDLELAESIYKAAVKAKPGYWYNYVWVGSFFLSSRPRYPEAEGYYRQAVKLAPDNPVPYNGLCASQFLQGDYAEAEKTCLKSIELRPNDRGYINLGVAYFGWRKYADAERSFAQAIKLNPGYYKSYGHLARTYYWTGRRSEAIALLGTAIDLAKKELANDPERPSVHVMLARYYAMLHDRSNAFSHLTSALLKRPNDPEYQCIAAVVHTQFGELAEAFRYLEKAVDFGYSIPDIEADRELDNLRADSQYRALFVGRQSAGR